MDLTKTLQTRYTTKAYNPERRIPEDIVQKLLDALRLSPSSVNSQPWHFIVADDDAGKARIAKATTGPRSYNTPKILNASHVIVLCARAALSESYLATVLEQEQADGRYADAKAKQAGSDTRAFYVKIHEDADDVLSWSMKQTYLAQGFLLLSAGLLNVDATPMEGFDADALSAEFNLAEQGLVPAVIVSLGYRADTDFNARLPKSRLPAESVISRA